MKILTLGENQNVEPKSAQNSKPQSLINPLTQNTSLDGHRRLKELSSQSN